MKTAEPNTASRIPQQVVPSCSRQPIETTHRRIATLRTLLAGVNCVTTDTISPTGNERDGYDVTKRAAYATLSKS